VNEVASGGARPPGAFECRPCRENGLSVRDGHLDTSREGILGALRTTMPTRGRSWPRRSRALPTVGDFASLTALLRRR